MREMKDSGIEWIGDIPVYWKIMPNKYLMRNEKKTDGLPCTVNRTGNIIAG